MEPVLMAAIVVGGALAIQAAFWQAQPRTRARRLLRKTRNVAVAEINDGEWVKVTGLAHAIGSVGPSLMGRRPCIGFQVEVQRLDRKSSAIVLRQESCPAFTITDGTGTVQVDGPFLFAIDWDAWSIVTAERLRILRECGVAAQARELRARSDGAADGPSFPGAEAPPARLGESARHPGGRRRPRQPLMYSADPCRIC